MPARQTVQPCTIVGALLLLFGTFTGAFNLEARLPLVKLGQPGSYFGFSVALHTTSNKSDSVKWILVGAPLGQNLQPNTTRSGAMFKCPITQENYDCEQVITDGRRDQTSIDDLLAPVETEEIKEDQWMGVTVQSQANGGKILVCAHRYILREKDAQNGQGLCYLLGNDFSFDESINPCYGRSTQRAHEEYSLCQVGTSGALFTDGTMALGAPGPHTWRGTIFVQSFDGEYLDRDKTMYYSPHTENVSPVDKYSYLGMSVTGGYYFGPDQMAYASGAPRSDNGEVLFFVKMIKDNNQMSLVFRLKGEQFASNFGYTMATADVNGDDLPDLLVAAPLLFDSGAAIGGAVYVYQNMKHTLPKNYTLRLTGQTESRFGQALANLGDINNDRCDDIAIGAPYEGDGVVYVYLGSKHGLSDKPSQVIRAADVAATRTPPMALRTFGYSLSGGVDVDENQYPDLLIGAYDSSMVVALLARPIINIHTEVKSAELRNIDPMQEGCAADRGTNATCFTFEACCSIEQYDIVHQQSSEVHQLKLEYVIEAETFDNKKKFSRVYFNGPKPSNVVRRQIFVTANGKIQCQTEIVYVREGTRDIQSTIKFRLSYRIVEKTLARTALLGLNPILDQTQADRVFEATFQKDCGDNDVCESQLYVNAELGLERDHDQYMLVLGEHDELSLNVTVTNSRESAYEAQLFVEHHPSISYIGATKSSGVICNRFNSTTVTCTLGNPLRRDDAAALTLRFDPSALSDSPDDLAFRVYANSTSAQLVPQAPVRLSVRVVKKVELSMHGKADPEQSFYGGAIRGESAMRYLDDIGPPVKHTFQIYNDGPWRAPELDVYIKWPHQVANDKAQGKWLLYLEDRPTVDGAGGGECTSSVENAFNPLGLEMRPVPVSVASDSSVPASLRMLREDNASEQLHMGGTLRFGGQQMIAYTENQTLSVENSTSRRVRMRRDRSMVIRAERLVDKEGKKTDIVNMNCDKNTAKCVLIKCKIYNMQRKSEAYIRVRSRLWNATLVADYPRVDMVNIMSFASIKVPDLYGIQQNRTDDKTFIVTRAYPELHDQAGDNSVPIWIIIVSIVGGLLLLALFTFCLWKMGFFKRRRPDPTLSGNLEKNRNGENKLLLEQKS